MPNGVLFDGGEVLLHSTIDGGEVALTRTIDGGEIGESFQPLPHISIGEVTTLPAGSEATATMTGTASQPLLNLGLVKGDGGVQGETGLPAGFGTVTATVDNNVGTPSVEVTTSGADTAKNFSFAFHNLKGEGSVRSVNNQTGDVVLDAEDVGALPDDTAIPTKISDLTNDMVYDLGTPTFNDGSFSLTQEQHTAIMQMWNNGLCAVTITVDGVTYWAIKEGVFTFNGMTFNTFVGTWATLGSGLFPTSGTVAVGIMPNMPLGGFMTVTDLDDEAVITDIYSYSPVLSVNTQTGRVVLTASDVGALPSSTAIPSKTSDLTNDSGFLTLSTLPVWDGSVT